MTGKGTVEDPVRPLYAPVPGSKEAAASGIIGFHYILSDDGKTALLELVATDSSAFESIQTDGVKRSEVKAFEKGKASKDEVAKEFKKLRKDFDIDKFEMRVR
jgi:hypothetical protein